MRRRRNEKKTFLYYFKYYYTITFASVSTSIGLNLTFLGDCVIREDRSTC